MKNIPGFFAQPEKQETKKNIKPIELEFNLNGEKRMKKLSYFIPHLILIALLANKKIIDKRKKGDHHNLRNISSLQKKNNLPEGNLFLNSQSIKSPEKKSPEKSLQEPSPLNQRLFSHLKLPEKLKKRLMDFLLSTQGNIPLSGDFDLSINEFNPHAESLIKELTSSIETLMHSKEQHWVVGPLINLVNQLEAPISTKNNFYSKIVELSRPEHFDSGQLSTAYGLQAIKQIANSNDFESIKTVFNSTMQKYGYNPQIFNELRGIEQEHNLMVKLNFGF